MMGHRIVKQPNGLYCVFSTVVDHVIMYDCAPEDIIEEELSDQRRRVTERVMSIVAELDAGGSPYHQFTESFDEMVDWIRQIHGSDDETLLALLNDANKPREIKAAPSTEADGA